MSQPKCPFCQGRHDFTKPPYYCPAFNNEEIPETYVADYDRVPPLWLVTVGFTQHGKTSYLAALTMMLEHMERVWPNTAQRYVDQHTFKAVQDIRLQADTGEQPKTTVKGVPRPLLIPMYGVPDAGSHCMVLYDTSGELYETLQGPDDVEYIRSLREVRNIWFLISLKDLKDNPRRRISDLLTIYLSGMQRLKWSLAKRNLIVVYTKADKVWSELPERVQTYLQDDPFKNVTNYDQDVADMSDFSLNSYVGEMRRVSTELEDYTRKRIPGGGSFIGLARQYGMGLFFTINSALGTDPDPHENRLRQDATRYRVLDPYLLALYLNMPRDDLQTIKLVLDAAKDSDGVYELALGNMAEKLSEMGEVTTYYLGQRTRVSVAGQTPPSKKPAKFRPRLIGPLLEQAEPNAKVIAVVGGPIQDLEDYSASPWRDRLLLVAVGDEPYQDWPNTVTLRSKDDDLDAVYTECKRLLQAQPSR
jgi:hypothetical protein